MRRVLATAAAALLGALAVVPAPAAQPIGIEITPAKLENDLEGRGFNTTLLLVNHDTKPSTISMSVAGLGHSLDGTWQFLEPAAATSHMTLGATTFTLAPGARREVRVDGRIPDADRGLYAGVLAEFSNTLGGGGPVEVRSRVATLFLIRAPKPWRQSIDVIDVGLRAGPKGRPATVFASVKNTGDVHFYPKGNVTISQNGKRLATVPLESKVVLPGFARRVTGSWTPPKGLSGKITLEADFGDARGTGTADLTPAGEVSTQSASIVNLRAHDEGGALVTLGVANTGNVALKPVVTLFAKQRIDGQEFERAREVFPQEELAPGASAELEWRPDLQDGIYLIVAQASVEGRLLDEASAGVQIGEVAAAPPRSSNRIGSAIMLVGLVMMASAIWLAFFRKPKKKRRAPVAAPPSVPASPAPAQAAPARRPPARKAPAKQPPRASGKAASPAAKARPKTRVAPKAAAKAAPRASGSKKPPAKKPVESGVRRG